MCGDAEEQVEHVGGMRMNQNKERGSEDIIGMRKKKDGGNRS